MGSKVQGEGDYESARRFNDESHKFVAEHTKDGQQIKGTASEATDSKTPAERKAQSHAKSGEQDKRDAKMLSDLQKSQKNHSQ